MYVNQGESEINFDVQQVILLQAWLACHLATFFGIVYVYGMIRNGQVTNYASFQIAYMHTV